MTDYAPSLPKLGGLPVRERLTVGGITLLVSHRFASVRAADLIIVIADGRITERGIHAQLLALGGAYTELYLLQAAGYS